MAGGIGRPMAALVPGEAERSFPERQARRRQVTRSLSERSRIVLRCAEGVPNKVVAAELGGDRRTVGKRRRRFLKDRLDGLSDGPRSGGPRTVGDDRVAYIIKRTLLTTPSEADAVPVEGRDRPAARGPRRRRGRPGGAAPAGRHPTAAAVTNCCRNGIVRLQWRKADGDSSASEDRTGLRTAAFNRRVSAVPA